MAGVRITRQAQVPRAWLARFRLEGPGLTERALYQLQPLIRRHLEAPFAFHTKALLGLKIEKMDPLEGLIQDLFILNIVPWRSMPANDPAYRMHYLVTTLRWRYESAIELATLPESGWSIVGFDFIDVLIAPGLETAPPRGGAGDRDVKLPESLHQKKGIWCPQVPHRCFEFCVRAAFLGVGDMTAAERLHTVRCTGRPFFEENRRRGRPAADSPPRELVDVGLDFGTVQSDEVSLEQIGDFEMANLGLVEIIVYGWVEKTWRGTRRVGETQLRVPLQEAIEARNPATTLVVLLLHEDHYFLVYNFDAFVSQRSSQINVRWRRGNCVNCCPICRANFKTELALRGHFRTGGCRHDFEGRRSQIALPLAAEAHLKYLTKSSCELDPVIVYADFEVFSDVAPEHAAVKGVQNRVAAAAYVAVGSCGYEPPEEHRLWMDHAREGEPEDSVVVRFLKSAQELEKHYSNWRKNEKKSIRWTPEQRAEHRQTQKCRECGLQFDSDSVKKCARDGHLLRRTLRRLQQKSPHSLRSHDLPAQWGEVRFSLRPQNLRQDEGLDG